MGLAESTLHCGEECPTDSDATRVISYARPRKQSRGRQNKRKTRGRGSRQESTMESSSEKVPDRQQMGFRLQRWILWWFYTTAAICTYDASFIVLRPHSMPGGSLSAVWAPYKPYLEVDGRYKDVKDPFVYGISLFNYLEVILNIITIIMHYKSSRHTVVLAFTVTVMTFWKTLFYFYAFTELGGGAPYRKGNTVTQEFFLVFIPNVIWVIVPFAVMVALWTRMIPPRSINWNSHVQVKPIMKTRSQSQHAKRA